MAEETICRICLDAETDTTKLIRPCNCTGSNRFVHRECLDKWRVNSIRPEAFHTCTTCMKRFEFEEDESPKKLSLPCDVYLEIFLEVFMVVLMLMLSSIACAAFLVIINDDYNMDKWHSPGYYFLFGLVIQCSLAGIVMFLYRGMRGDFAEHIRENEDENVDRDLMLTSCVCCAVAGSILIVLSSVNHARNIVHQFYERSKRKIGVRKYIVRSIEEV